MKSYDEDNCLSESDRYIRKGFRRLTGVDVPKKGDIIMIRGDKEYYEHMGVFLDEFLFIHTGVTSKNHVSRYEIYKHSDHKVLRVV